MRGSRQHQIIHGGTAAAERATKALLRRAGGGNEGAVVRHVRQTAQAAGGVSAAIRQNPVRR